MIGKTVAICVIVMTLLMVYAVVRPPPQAQLPGAAGIIAAIDAGCTPYHLANGTAASTNINVLLAQPGRLCDLTLVNTSTTIAYIHVYNIATSPTCSTTGATLMHTFPIPPAAASGQASGLQRTISTSGEIYSKGIGYCVTGAGADGDTTNAPTGVFIEGSYRTVPP